MNLIDRQYETLLEMLNWRVSVDILLITFIIFAIYRLFKWTGTWKILTGILLLGLLFIVARILNLSGIQWIYATLSPVVVISFIIIFQPEIRKIMEKTASFHQGQQSKNSTEILQVLSDTVFHLAKQKWGGLIVLPGRDSIHPWISGGIPVQAVPSFPLLVSIFAPHSGGHDGAVVIKNNKIHTFSARLPLSTSCILPEEYGTRHYAALGLSEKTDALVIAISEERGKISLFCEGKMIPCKNPDDFKNTANHFLKKNSRLSFLSESTSSKLAYLAELVVCFFVAVFFWSSINLSGKTSMQSTHDIVAESELSEWVDYDYRIEPNLVGTVANGFMIDTVIVYPGAIRGSALGEESKPDSLFLITTPIFIDSLSENKKIITQLDVPAEVKLPETMSPFVEVVIFVKRIPEMKMNTSIRIIDPAVLNDVE